MKIEIKPATMENLKDIQDLNLLLRKNLINEFNHELNQKWSIEKGGEEFFRYSISNKNACSFVAIADEKIIGYLVGSICDEDLSRTIPISAEIDSFFVSDKFQSHGIGTRLYSTFIDWARSKNIKRIRVETLAGNVRGIKFYQKCGMHDHDLILECEI
ncbi:MAG: GNAT family N-acetyltransferase [Candidatus Magasanikbacteria bacterium]|nr:GNAT family N-acetyltransferase [Candidatus Magasanikbacteria bacterium]